MNNFTIKYTNRFKKSYNKLISTQSFNKANFKFVIDSLIRNQILPQHFKNHLLFPKANGIWECHISPDCLLLYEKDITSNTIFLIDIGSHSNIFK